ncbi:hypothetical protein GUITHDRAFT_118755 [Guillardia theta CCMP2712]|uniref:Uncharacterized protein n=1 Tax=Guillardia theta (strain CCMP2712) TaxID=905079 RepID=L1IG83_GUITC|nr:hypothetical protein GUITHDRAFT_118755 [Guillardia theta CCMP2712]EKX35102.1 hypothetical protein GUITHDRAFT_118755 [Guillardia theta CCMP2712]|eukprot:XP_005822082.1 hypothetical protein GUITHDRAFT_118755 [Guillardia theta CCMP2712]
MDRFVEMFLRGEALRGMLLYMCNSCTVEINDPITHTLCTFMTTPVSLCVTKTGLAPLKDCNMAILPFGCMTPEQKAFLNGAINEMQAGGLATLSTQMGGGGMAQLNYRGPKRYLPAEDVLTQFCAAVRCSGSHLGPEIKDNVCNIVIQRVCSMVHVPRSTLAAISKESCVLRECAEASAAYSVSSSGPPTGS